MRKLIFIMIASLSFTAVNAQTNNDLEEVLQNCLDSLVERRNEFLGRSHEEPTTIPMYISTKNFPPHFEFRNEIFETRIKYINMANPKAHRRRLRKGVRLTTLSTLSLDNNKLKIHFTEWIVRMRGRIYMGVSDGTNFTYEYSCEKQEWVLIEVKVWGI